MDAQDIRHIVTWLAEARLTSLQLDGPDFSLRLGQPMASQAQPLLSPSAPSHAALEASVGESCVTVSAPSVGHFLDTHPMRSSPFVPIGQAVRGGQVLGLMQAGALLWPVCSPIDGVLRQVLQRPGEPTGFGTPLFAIDPLV